MPPSVCRGCTNRLSNCNAGVDIFSQEGSSNSMVENKVKTGIEMITGLTVSNTDGLPSRLCTDCNEKVNGFLAFRTQLISSVRYFRGSGNTSAKSSPLDNDCQVITPVPPPELNEELRITDSELNNINVDEDIESEIDVCSGEDDEVLELDVQNNRDEIYEIESSGESDIQVCDYTDPTAL